MYAQATTVRRTFTQKPLLPQINNGTVSHDGCCSNCATSFTNKTLLKALRIQDIGSGWRYTPTEKLEKKDNLQLCACWKVEPTDFECVETF